MLFHCVKLAVLRRCSTASGRNYFNNFNKVFLLLCCLITILSCGEGYRFRKSYYSFPTQQQQYRKQPLLPQQQQQDTVCSQQCSPGSNSGDLILKYAPGIAYKYRAEGSAVFWQSSSAKTGINQLKYVTDFEIRFESSCSGILKLNGVQLFTATEKKYGDKKILDGAPVRFTFQNGKINSQLCAEKTDSPISLNIKRAILSNLQISPSTIGSSTGESFEVDIFGQCPTKYEYKKDTGSTWIVWKNKYLNRCVNREGLQHQNENGGSKPSNPLVKATVSSEFKVTDGIIQRVDVTEQYTYVPLNFFAEAESSVTVKSTITFVSQSKRQIAVGSVMYPTTLLYEAPPPLTTSVGIDTIMNALKVASSAINSYGSNVSPTAAVEFKRFVDILRQANKMEILAAYVQAKSGAGLKEKSAARICFVDGLLSAGTDQSAEAMLELIRSRAFPEDKISAFLVALANVNYPAASTLNSANTLLDRNVVNNDVYAAVGILAGKYIENNPNKLDEPDLKNLLNALSSPVLKGYRRGNTDEENRFIASLKGLENVKYLSDSIDRKLIQYAKDKGATDRLRSIVLQTMRTDPSDEIKKAALEILLDKTEDAEIRINAFLAYIADPDKETAYQIKLLIDTEESIQVGGYISSYIMGLRNSIQPDKELPKEYLANIVMKNRFPRDVRQYSQNLEVSQIFAALNIGYSANVDVIYSADSYMPRFTSFNLNSYAFGRPANLFQVDVRVENLDTPVDNIFGPRSYLRTNEVDDIADDVSNYISSIPDMISKRYSVAGGVQRTTFDIGNFMSKMKRKRHHVSSDDVISFDLNLKRNGQIVKWLTYSVDLKNINTDNNLENLKRKIEDVILELKNLDLHYQNYYQSSLLADDTAYPTTSGFPLTLKLDLTSVVNLDLKSQIKVDLTEMIDVAGIMKQPQWINIQLDYKPGISVLIEGTLSIDAYLVKAGLKASATLNTATDLNFSLKLVEGRGFEFTYNTPGDVQDIISLQTGIYSTIEEKGGNHPLDVPVNSDGARYSQNIQSLSLSDYLGATVQLEADVPALSLKPSFGPSKFAIRFVKTDPSVTGYYIAAFYKPDNQTGNKSLSFIAQVMGRDQKIALLLASSPKDRKIGARLTLPSRDISLTGFVIDTKTEFSYNLNLMTDSITNGVKLGVYISGPALRQVYQPFLALISPNDLAREQALSGMRLSQSKAQPYLPITFNGNIIVIRKSNNKNYKRMEFQSLAVNTMAGELVLNGNVDSDLNNFNSDLTLSYGSAGNEQRSVNVVYNSSTDELQQSPPYLSKRSNVFAVSTSQYPKYNFKFDSDYQSGIGTNDLKTTFMFGPDFNDLTKRIVLHESLQFSKSPVSNRYGGKLIGEVQFPFYQAELATKVEVADMGSTFHLKYNQDNNLYDILATCRFDPVEKSKIDTDLLIIFENQRFLMTTKWNEASKPNTYLLISQIKTFSGLEIILKSDVTYEWSPTNFILQANSVIKVGREQNYKLDYTIKYSARNIVFYIHSIDNGVRFATVKVIIDINGANSSADIILYLDRTFEHMLLYSIRGNLFTGQLQWHTLSDNSVLRGTIKVTEVEPKIYDADMLVNWNQNNSNLNTVKLTSKTTLENGLQTNNKIDINNKQFNVNANVLLLDDHQGNSNVSGDIEIILPDNKGSIVGNAKHFIERNSNGLNVGDRLEFYRKKSNDDIPIKFTYDFVGKNIDFTNGILTYDVSTGVMVALPKDKNYNAGLMLKKVRTDQTWTVAGQVYLSGSAVSYPVDLKGQSTYSDDIYKYGLLNSDSTNLAVTYALSGLVGADYSINVEGALSPNKFSNVGKANIPYGNSVKIITWNNAESFAIGNDEITFTSDNSVTYNGDRYANWNILTVVALKNGKFVANWETDAIKKRHLEALYTWDISKDKSSVVETSVDLSYEDKQIGLRLKYIFDYLNENLTILGNGLVVDKPFSVILKRKMSEDFRNHVVDIIVSSHLGDWYLSTDVTLDDRKPRLNVEYKSSEGETKVLLLADQISPTHWSAKTELKWSQDGGGYLNADYESKLNYPAELLLIVNIDSPKLNIDRWHLEAASTKTTAEKKIALNIATVGAAYITGNLVYDVQQDDKKLLVHGSGQINYRGTKNYPLVFKYVQQTFDLTSDGEEGTLDKCSISLDGKSYVWNLEKKVTDKAIILRREYCENSDCHTMGLAYEIKIDDMLNYERSLLLQLDMKPTIVDGENLIIASKTVSNGITYEHSTDFQWAPQRMISYKSYINNNKLGANLKLPNREIAAEYSYMYKLSLARCEIKTLATLWLDKSRNEKNKIVLLSGGYYNADEEKSTVTVKTTSVLQVPNLQKKIAVGTDLDLILNSQKIIDFKANFDVFNREDQAILVVYQLSKDNTENGIVIKDIATVTSKGQNMDIEINRSLLLSFEKFGQYNSIRFTDSHNSDRKSSFDVEVQLTSIVTSVNILDLIKFKDTFTINGSSQFVQLSNRFDVLDRYYTGILKVSREPKIWIGIDSKGLINQRLELSLSAVYNEAAYLNVQLTNKKGKKTMLNSQVSFADQDFLDTNSEINIDAVAEIMDDTKKEYLVLSATSKLIQKKIIGDLKEQYVYRAQELQNALIPKNTIIGGVANYVKAVNVELLSDESFKSTANHLSMILNNTVRVLIALNNQLANLADKLENAVEEIYEQIVTLLKQLMPSVFDWIDETYEKISDYINKYVEDASERFNDWLEYIKTIHQRWKEILKTVAAVLKSLIKSFPKIKERLIQRYNQLKDNILYLMSYCPVCNLIARLFEELKNSDIPRYAWNAISAVGQWFKEYLPTMEMKTLLDSVLQFVEKILLQKPVNLISELKNMGAQLIDAVRSLIDLANKSFSVPNLMNKEYLPTINLQFIKNALMSATNVWPVAIETLKMIRYPDFSLIGDSLYMYRPNLNPIDLLPPYKKAAVIVNRQHMITFNGRYIKVTSDCPILLTSEAENGAFTVLANFQNGLINKIFVMANNSENIEITVDGKILVNGSESDLPMYSEYMTAVRNYHNIEIRIDNSVRIICSLDLNVISIHVSGFYHGSLDGILGPANGEPFSDYFKTDETVLSSVRNRIGGKYQSIEKCAKQVTEGKLPDIINEQCSEIFSTKSVLRRAFFVINPDVYRTMCHQVVSSGLTTPEDKLSNACRASLAYSLVSSANGDFLEQPSQCGHCTIGNDRIPLASGTTLSMPQGKAEILIILEKSSNNAIIYEEFLKNLIPNLTLSLKLSGLEDVKLILMTYGPDEKYPSIQTTNGGIYLNDRTKITFSPHTIADKQHTKFGYAVQDAKYALGHTDIIRVLNEAANYPFSADAVRAVIIAKGKPDEKVSFDLYDTFNFINGLLPATSLLIQGIPVIEIVPMEKIIYRDNQNLSVYGFDSTHLYTTDGEIKVAAGGPILRTNLYRTFQSSMLLALPLNGAVFDANELSSSPKDTTITDTFIKRVTGSLTSDKRQVSCTCAYKWGTYAQPKCYIKLSTRCLRCFSGYVSTNKKSSLRI